MDSSGYGPVPEGSSRSSRRERDDLMRIRCLVKRTDATHNFRVADNPGITVCSQKAAT